MTKKQAVEKAAEVHTNLNIFAAVVSILEGGHLYAGSTRTHNVADRIIAMCQKEQGHLLTEYDAAVDKALAHLAGQAS